eukprot:GHVS01007165.1.p1 GENE.GHVS01007165.1~~GHVS01007165.1.p1  ORF type:complete len:537 (-),score=97.02 GHVS01007165.1:187-1797(-)
MSMYDSEEFWHDFMRRPDAQKALKLEQKMLMKEHAQELSSEYDQESVELKTALLQCSVEVKHMVRPIVRYPMVHRILHNLLKECKANGSDFNAELSRPDRTVALQLKSLHNEWKSDPDNVKALQDKWTDICLEAKQKITQDSHVKKEHTWRDIPQEELAERLSKGEIMPRDEWIPGVSKGKRKLDANSLKQHLTLGEQMRRDGVESYKKEDYEMAFTRFTQGVQLLNWVEGSNSDDNRMAEEMFVAHLRNQALAAIKCEKYHEALKACNTIIQDIDEHDCKAHYRRGKAYGLLGMVKYAKDDYVFIIKSPYADRDSVKAAKAAMNELRAILNKYKNNARDIVTKSIAEDTFSENRQVVSSTASDGSPPPPPFACNVPPSMRRPPSAVTGRRQWFSEAPLKVEEEEEDAPPPSKAAAAVGLHRLEPWLSVEKTKELLEDLLDIYTKEEIQQEIDECKRLGDYEERRALVRIRKVLPKVQMPILHRYGLANQENDFDYFDAKKAMEQTVGYWRSRDKEVKDLARECWDAVFADITDLD